jgi:transcriptional regulator with XRE-family HTH domain
MRRIESGRTNPTILTLKKISEGLEVTLEELVRVDEKKKK